MNDTGQSENARLPFSLTVYDGSGKVQTVGPLWLDVPNEGAWEPAPVNFPGGHWENVARMEKWAKEQLLQDADCSIDIDALMGHPNVKVPPLAVAPCSAGRLAKLAEALGWMRGKRLGKEVWYDQTGGHVSWEELPAAIEADITELIDQCKDKPRRADDAAALEKLGNPFSLPNAASETRRGQSPDQKDGQ